jgi:hypothetical protein
MCVLALKSWRTVTRLGDGSTRVVSALERLLFTTIVQVPDDDRGLHIAWQQAVATE